MLVAKLKNTLNFVIQTSPVETENKVVDSFYVITTSYILGGKHQDFNIHFTESHLKFSNPASEVMGEGIEETEFITQKIFSKSISNEELSTWGTDDTSLLYIIADIYGLEIDEVVISDNVV